MNFKIFLSLIVFTLIGAIYTAPIHNNGCQGYFLQFNKKSYTCLVQATLNSVKCKYYVKVREFNQGQINIYCVDEEHSTLNVCNKSSDEFDHEQCLRNLNNKGKEKNIDINIFNEDFIKEVYSCAVNRGLFLTTSDDDRYACLVRDASEVNGKNCVVNKANINADPLCVLLTNVDTCSKGTINYNYHECIKFLFDLGNQNDYEFDQLMYYKVLDLENLRNKQKELCKEKNGIFHVKSLEDYSCIFKPDNMTEDEMIEIIEGCEEKKGIFLSNSNGEYTCFTRPILN